MVLLGFGELAQWKIQNVETIKDDRRDLFIRRYFFALSGAIKGGCDVRGYSYWSLLDNFEWAEGYDMKFGLYEVNFATQERKLREGARYFGEVVNKQL